MGETSMSLARDGTGGGFIGSTVFPGDAVFPERPRNADIGHLRSALHC
jgi:hypothetical protein